MEFSSELLKQHIRNISEVLPINTYVVLYGNKDGVVNKLDRTYSLNEISLSHTGEDHHHDPEIFFDNSLDIDILLTAIRNLYLFCRKEKQRYNH